LRSLTLVLAGLASWNKQFSISGEMDFPLFYRKKIVRTLLVACCAAFPGFHAGAAPDLAVGSTSACPDSNGTVPVNFVAGAGVVSLQFDLQFEDAKLISGTPVGGSALADHQVASNVVTNGLLRVLIFSFSNTPLTNGVLVNVPFSIKTDAPPGVTGLILTNVVLSDAAANSVPPTSVTSGSLTILPPGERINQEGRILGPAPAVTNSILFNTPAADAVVSAMQILPLDNPWNEDISRRPALTNSDAMIQQIMSDLLSTRRTLRAFYEMNFVLVPDDQPPVPVNFFNYADESDPSPYPIPSNLPIETWPHETGPLTLQQWQQDINNDGGDRHAVIVQPGNGLIWETWLTKLVGTNWEASNGAKFDLNSDALRPAAWTSGDAAGLPMFPALVRYDECGRGMVEHALRLVVKHTRADFIYPARHYASVPYTTNANVPAMGQRLRLKSSFAVPDNWTVQEKAVLRAFKKYGALVADNGNFFSISVTPDDRWPGGVFDHLSTISVTNFEVVQATGPNEGPRSPNPPVPSAGPDQAVALGTTANLRGFVSFNPTNPPPTVAWQFYSGPGTVTFGDATKTNTTATFSAPGAYTLMLGADDGVHSVARDAVVITVIQPIVVNIAQASTNVTISWLGGSPPFVLEESDTLPAALWSPLLSTNSSPVTVPVANRASFFRVRGQSSFF